MRLAYAGLLSILTTLVVASASAQDNDTEDCKKKCEAEAELMVRRIQQSCSPPSFCERATAQQYQKIPLCIDECVMKRKYPR
jgi:hypothetical protein